jgi:hypothetical protein
MPDFRFLLHHRALLAYNTLTRREREALEAAVAPLTDQAEDHWAALGATRLDTAESLFLVKVDKSLRAIVRPTEGGQPEVVDLVRHEMLERFFQAS